MSFNPLHCAWDALSRRHLSSQTGYFLDNVALILPRTVSRCIIQSSALLLMCGMKSGPKCGLSLGTPIGIFHPKPAISDILDNVAVIKFD